LTIGKVTYLEIELQDQLLYMEHWKRT